MKWNSSTRYKGILVEDDELELMKGSQEEVDRDSEENKLEIEYRALILARS